MPVVCSGWNSDLGGYDIIEVEAICSLTWDAAPLEVGGLISETFTGTLMHQTSAQCYEQVTAYGSFTALIED